jgi:hypothetical protein
MSGTFNLDSKIVDSTHQEAGTANDRRVLGWIEARES